MNARNTEDIFLRTLDRSHKIFERVHVILECLLVVALLVLLGGLFDDVDGFLLGKCAFGVRSEMDLGYGSSNR